MSASVILIGVGNRYRRDDGVGPAIIDSLAARLPASMLRTSDGEITSLLSCFEDFEEVVIIDAIDDHKGASKSGDIISFDSSADHLEDPGLRASTHAMGVSEAIEMARVLGKLPRRLSIIGIVGADFSNAEGLSDSVQQAADKVSRLLVEEYCHA